MELLMQPDRSGLFHLTQSALDAYVANAVRAYELMYARKLLDMVGKVAPDDAIVLRVLAEELIYGTRGKE